MFYRDTEKKSAEGEALPNSVPMDMPEALVPVREDILTLQENEQEIGWRSDVSLSNRFGLFSAGLRVSSLDLEFSTTLADDWLRYEYDGRDSTPDETTRYVTLTPENINSAYADKETQYAAYVEQVLERDEWSVRMGVLPLIGIRFERVW